MLCQPSPCLHGGERGAPQGWGEPGDGGGGKGGGVLCVRLKGGGILGWGGGWGGMHGMCLLALCCTALPDKMDGFGVAVGDD